MMGAWLGVSALLALNFYQTFSAVDSVLASPPEQAARMFRSIGIDNARALLRYTAGVENADTFEIWEDIQICLGLLLTTVLFMSSSMRYLAAVPLVMTLLVVFLHLKITPDLIWLGRSLEFKPALGEAVSREQFWTLHRIYGILDVVKCLLGAGLAGYLMVQSGTKVVRRRHHHERETAPEFDRHATSR